MNLPVHTVFAALLTVLATSTIAAANDPAVGIWKTEPDRKKLISHIRIHQCGSKLCGTVIRAFDSNGKQANTKHVGKELFWGIEPLGNGDYKNGTVYVPLLNVKAKASMQLRGRNLHVTGCKGGVCDGQVWSRF
ncbi:DUF2147 domain-containing protein [Neptunicoccus cionae]|uniref:DUF2147 domain-containing protein n=1 Tax=Neptunicoccus cionae TaxID=2035344 RepID=A0A916QZ38_9RHOB|nr:DUF2147 domain-containing protein [Amylibacter cionae]GGA19251.1 hypothetical protein GCM10011498_20110 [Amylibacter cionae]